jgi:hypothetical protein
MLLFLLFPLFPLTHLPPSLSLSQDPEDRLRAFKGLIQHWLHQTQRILKDIVPLFNEVGVDYITWYFRALDPLVRVTHTCTHEMFIYSPTALLLLVPYIHMSWV